MPEKRSVLAILAEKSDSISLKTFFFGGHLFLGGKNFRISKVSEKFRRNFRTNSGQGRLQFSHSFKNTPPPFPNSGYAPGTRGLKH